MSEQLLRDFAKENFGKNYFLVKHGKHELIKPFGLMIKQDRSPLLRPFKRSEYIAVGGLEGYLQEDKKDAFLDAVKSHIKKEQNLLRGADGKDGGGAVSNVEVAVDAGNYAGASIKIDNNLGELDFGKIDEEYMVDLDLRAILAKTEIDGDLMEDFKDKSLRLIHTVLYSERFELKGKRETAVEVEGKVQVPNPLLAKLKGHVKTLKTRQKMATRTTRGPIFFQCCRVTYDPATRHLKPNEIIGKATHRDVGEDEEFKNTVLGLENEDSDFADHLIDEDDKKLDKIVKSVLKPTKNREERKARVTKYLKWFEDALNKDQKEISIDEPLSEADCKFLRSIFVKAIQNQTLVDLSNFEDEKIQGYAIVLKVIADMSDEEWDDVEKAWDNGK